MSIVFRRLSLLLITTLLSPVVFADLIMTAPPRESVEAGTKLYAPIANYLSKALGEKVVYKHPRNWLHYQSDMRADKYDIVFDGPHFISWRIKHLGARAMVKLPGKLQFFVVSMADDKEIKKIEDVIGKRVCGIAPPNLATLSMMAKLNNPARQPVLHPVRGGFKSVNKEFKQGKCRAAIFRTAFFKKKLPQSDRDMMRIIYTSPALPNQGFSVSSRISSKKLQKIRSAMLSRDGTAASANLLKRFGGKAKGFKTAINREFKDQYLFLEGVIFGW
ncbi:MAG TPA: hypothetical protein ENI64_09730 [Gammaproteobacteria bacterium]|nr:hypothetical protein [Gammaproteobacteria bacterium]